MIEFFAFSAEARIFITFLLGVCVLAQTLALVLNFFRRSLITLRFFENLLEAAILCQLLVFSILYGQVVSGYKNGLVVPSGHENLRIIVFSLILIFVIVTCFLTKNIWPLIIIPPTAISLPIVENAIGRVFPLFFVASLILLLYRSIKICVSSLLAIRTDISALSVKNAIDTLHTGVLFSESDGYTLLSNYQMQNLMISLTGKTYRNSTQFYDMLISGQDESRYKKAKLEGQMVYLLPNGSAWMFTKTDISFRGKNHIHISAADVSELWILTAKLQLQNEQLRQKSDDLKHTIASLHILCKEKEIENARMRAHDILGQRLSVLLSTIQNERNLDYDLLTSLSKGLLDELKAEQSKIGPCDDLQSIKQIFAAIGVDIRIEGLMPNDTRIASLFVDVIREGCTNAVRHGLATQIDIKFESTNDSYNLTIVNNGHTVDMPITSGSGIKVIRKKISAQDGNLDIIHYPLFTLCVVLPGGEK